ncbi:MAG TPA: hypothetical protein VMU50_13385 [Polyangia bacterium]|nr:hypothetical protein [Polyangia bacterium]
MTTTTTESAPTAAPRWPSVSPARSDAGWSLKTFVGATAGVLAARALYLFRFGWDIGWMNQGYLASARLIALGGHQSVEEQPLAYFALLAARRLGFSARAANEAVYLVAHLLLALGVLGLARFVWPGAGARRRWALAVAVAVTPLLACESGRNNLGAALAAGLAASALAVGATAATATRVRAGEIAQFLFAALLAALATAGRYEALATCTGAALVLALLGGRMPGVPQHRRAAVALGVGVAAGLLAVMAVRRALAGGAAPTGTYGLYTFYDGLPLLMFPHLPSTEYARYRASVGFFGGFQENHGSLLRALLHHPGWALVRFITKPVDQLAVLLWFYGLTPIGVALAAIGTRGISGRRPGEWQRGWLLAAFLLPLAMLLVPQQNPAYYLSVAAPLLLAMARGADRIGARLPPRTARTVGAATTLIGIALIAVAGKRTITNSRALNDAAAYLETRCQQTGCLTNSLPQSIGSQAWVVTDAGAPFPPRVHRDEQAVLEGFRPKDASAFNYCARVDRARANHFAGPVLYVDARIKTFTAFDPDFDPTVRFQGTLDRANLIEERRFTAGPDEVIIYRLGEDSPCRHAAGAAE